MCEFKVTVRTRDGERKIAEEIIRAYYEAGKLVLVDILGAKQYLDDALIRSIDVSREQLEILQPAELGQGLLIKLGNQI